MTQPLRFLAPPSPVHVPVLRGYVVTLLALILVRVNTDSSYRILSSGGGRWNCEHRIWIPRHINGRLGSPIVLNWRRESNQSATSGTILTQSDFEIHFSGLQRWSPSRPFSGCWLSSSCCFPAPFTYFDGCIAAIAPPTINQILVTTQFCRRCLRPLAMDNLRTLRCNHIPEVLAITSELWVQYTCPSWSRSDWCLASITSKSTPQKLSLGLSLNKSLMLCNDSRLYGWSVSFLFENNWRYPKMVEEARIRGWLERFEVETCETPIV